MIERRISIGNIDPIDFYGINNAKFITLKEFFPKLKITARGDEIIIQGEESDIDVLVAKINALLEHYNKYNMLTIANLKRIILEDEIVEDPEDPASHNKIQTFFLANYLIVYSPSIRNLIRFTICPGHRRGNRFL